MYNGTTASIEQYNIAMRIIIYVRPPIFFSLYHDIIGLLLTLVAHAMLDFYVNVIGYWIEMRCELWWYLCCDINWCKNPATPILQLL